MIETKKRRVCDATGVTRGVKRYKVTVKEVNDFGQELVVENVISDVMVDLGKRGLARLTNFIDRGTTSQTREAKPEPGPLTDAERKKAGDEADKHAEELNL